MNPPQGLEYTENIVNLDLNQQILEWYKSEDTQSKLFSVNGTNSRKVIQYGYKYDYKTTSRVEQIEPIPDLLKQLLILIGLPNLNQCIINRYLPGQGINAHIDSLMYGDTIACFTFLSSREMEFNRDAQKFTIITKPRSVYIMKGESRYDWKHQMRPRLKDGQTKRAECFSITFREVHLGKPVFHTVKSVQTIKESDDIEIIID